MGRGDYRKHFSREADEAMEDKEEWVTSCREWTKYTTSAPTR
jgi:hypothetical protein